MSVFAPRFVRFVGLLESLGASDGIRPLKSCKILITSFAVPFHRYESEPGESLVHYVGRRPVVRSVEVMEDMGKAGLL